MSFERPTEAAMSEKTDNNLKIVLVLSIVIALLLAGVGIFYYYVIFAPNIEREKLELQKHQFNQERQDEIDARKRAEHEQNEALKASELREQQRNIAYTQCINIAEENYSDYWQRSCQKIAAANKAALDKCLNNNSIMSNEYMGESYCKRVYGTAKYNADCSLPTAQAENIEKRRKENKERCLAEAQNALI